MEKTYSDIKIVVSLSKTKSELDDACAFGAKFFTWKSRKAYKSTNRLQPSRKIVFFFFNWLYAATWAFVLGQLPVFEAKRVTTSLYLFCPNVPRYRRSIESRNQARAIMIFFFQTSLPMLKSLTPRCVQTHTNSIQTYNNPIPIDLSIVSYSILIIYI